MALNLTPGQKTIKSKKAAVAWAAKEPLKIETVDVNTAESRGSSGPDCCNRGMPYRRFYPVRRGSGRSLSLDSRA